MGQGAAFEIRVTQVSSGIPQYRSQMIPDFRIPVRMARRRAAMAAGERRPRLRPSVRRVPRLGSSGRPPFLGRSSAANRVDQGRPRPGQLDRGLDLHKLLTTAVADRYHHGSTQAFIGGRSGSWGSASRAVQPQKASRALPDRLHPLGTPLQAVGQRDPLLDDPGLRRAAPGSLRRATRRRAC
jgi:hypothetical protein